MRRITRAFEGPLLAAGLLLLFHSGAAATIDALPADFSLPAVTYGGAGGGLTREEAKGLHRYPVVMVAGLGRDHRDWTGRNPGNIPPWENGSVYDRLLLAGFRPVELWMIDFAREGAQMSSLEEATDDLKLFIAAVLRYTGADRVHLLAHDTGGLLARLTILKYHIAHWIESEVYIGAPFHGLSDPPDPHLSLHGYPNAWLLSPGSGLLRELFFRGESPTFRHPREGKEFRLKTLTIRNGTADGDPRFAGNPDSPALAGARNVALPGLDHDGLRTSSRAADLYLPFLTVPAAPPGPGEDGDGDGLRSAELGGADCDDGDPAVFPGAEEVRGDGVDQDCNGHDLAVHGGRDGEIPLL